MNSEVGTQYGANLITPPKDNDSWYCDTDCADKEISLKVCLDKSLLGRQLTVKFDVLTDSDGFTINNITVREILSGKVPTVISKELTPKEVYNAVRKPVSPWDKRYKQKGKVKR